MTNDIFEQVWRTNFTAPGFYVHDAGCVDSITLRGLMHQLKLELSARKPLFYRSLARFDQQVTTKFHLDGAPPESILLLGYEPSNVKSRLFLADYLRCAFELNLTLDQFFRDYNPMYRKGEDLLKAYTTELPQPLPGHSTIVIINNSSLPFDGVNTLGLMHKAEISPNEAETRLINSVMLSPTGPEVSLEAQQHFLTTTEISQKNY